MAGGSFAQAKQPVFLPVRGIEQLRFVQFAFEIGLCSLSYIG
jgi:hypothetical protein